MEKKEIFTDKEIEKIITRGFWGPYSPPEMKKMVHGAKLVLDDLTISETTPKAIKDVDNWMGWLEKRIVINPMERDYIEFALRQIRK